MVQLVTAFLGNAGEVTVLFPMPKTHTVQGRDVWAEL